MTSAWLCPGISAPKIIFAEIPNATGKIEKPVLRKRYGASIWWPSRTGSKTKPHTVKEGKCYARAKGELVDHAIAAERVCGFLTICVP